LRGTLAVALVGACVIGASGLVVPTASGSRNAVRTPRSSLTKLQTMYLNTYQDAAHDMPANVCLHDTRCGPQVNASAVLARGTTYVVEVVGAVSVSGTGLDDRYLCGKPQPMPEFASPGVTAQPANDDAQFLFAEPNYGTKPCPKFPVKSSAFLIKLGRSSRWFHPIASGHPKRPSGDRNAAHNQHPYTFVVVGQGATIHFRFRDYYPSDNDGRFRIEILTQKATTPVS
jgi:hypothetical protein